MPMAVFVHSGDAIDYTSISAVAAGEVVVIGDLIGVAKEPIPSFTPGSVVVSGVFDFVRNVGTAVSAGTKIYWDATNKLATTSDGSGVNKLLGKSTMSAAATSPTVRVRLSP